VVEDRVEHELDTGVQLFDVLQDPRFGSTTSKWMIENPLHS
jgi:hypothetical protein